MASVSHFPIPDSRSLDVHFFQFYNIIKSSMCLNKMNIYMFSCMSYFSHKPTHTYTIPVLTFSFKSFCVKSTSRNSISEMFPPKYFLFNYLLHSLVARISTIGYDFLQAILFFSLNMTFGYKGTCSTDSDISIKSTVQRVGHVLNISFLLSFPFCKHVFALKVKNGTTGIFDYIILIPWQ